MPVCCVACYLKGRRIPYRTLDMLSVDDLGSMTRREIKNRCPFLTVSEIRDLKEAAAYVLLVNGPLAKMKHYRLNQPTALEIPSLENHPIGLGTTVELFAHVNVPETTTIVTEFIRQAVSYINVAGLRYQWAEVEVWGAVRVDFAHGMVEYIVDANHSRFYPLDPNATFVEEKMADLKRVLAPITMISLIVLENAEKIHVIELLDITAWIECFKEVYTDLSNKWLVIVIDSQWMLLEQELYTHIKHPFELRNVVNRYMFEEQVANTVCIDAPGRYKLDKVAWLSIEPL